LARFEKIYSFKTAFVSYVVEPPKDSHFGFLTATKREEDFAAEIEKMVKG